MIHHPIHLIDDRRRAFAVQVIAQLPEKTVVSFKEPTRTTPQNNKMWAMLTDVSRAQMDGRKHIPEVWKSIFMHALKHESQFVQALDGEGFFPIGFKTSNLTVPQMGELIEFISAEGSQRGVQWSDWKWADR